ncbi:MAG: PQQ-like beta-propeller repeat protein [Planctomycetia bacterium]|nr:PQQ-like beta-propeller repeat protein [Planctomycetia bacterium]
MRSAVILCLAIAMAGALAPTGAVAQNWMSRRVELSDAIDISAADSSARSKLTQLRALIAEAQWSEAIETLRRVQEEQGSALFQLPEPLSGQRGGLGPLRRHMTVRDYCHLQISALPDEALAMYRERVDALAEQWFSEASAGRDRRLLRRIVDEFFCSNVGDDALLLLGDLALEAGEFDTARHCWSRILPVSADHAVRKDVYELLRTAEGLDAATGRLLDEWYKLDTTADPPAYVLRAERPLTPEGGRALARFWKSRGYLVRLTYPDSPLPAAAVEARLVLLSIMEGPPVEAAQRLARFAAAWGDAEGKFGGRQVKYREALAALLELSATWEALPPDRAWPTLGGNPERNGRAAGTIDIRAPAWRLPLSRVTLLDPSLPASHSYRPRRPAEDAGALLSHHPVVADGRVYYCNENQVFAVNLADGKPCWPTAEGQPAGEIYHSDQRPGARGNSSLLGVPRFTLSVQGDRLLARMGSPVTSSPAGGQSGRKSDSFVLCLDLAAQGRLVWEYRPATDDLAVEGSPVSDGRRAFVAVRKGGVSSRASVVALDLQSGRVLWEQSICGANTPGGGDTTSEATHNLLTVHEGTVFYNTNLGCVAALVAEDGKFRWLSAYPRAKPREDVDLIRKPAHFYRDLNPCVYHRGLVYAAPSDFDGIMALDASTGELVWQTQHPEDAVHVLGVTDEALIVSGDKLWWFDARYGNARTLAWPQGPNLRGFGRGILTSDRVYFPTRDQIYVFEQASGQMVRQPIDLKIWAEGPGGGPTSGTAVPGDRNTPGGNLIVAEGYLLIAGAEELTAFRLDGQPAGATKKD